MAPLSPSEVWWGWEGQAPGALGTLLPSRAVASDSPAPRPLDPGRTELYGDDRSYSTIKRSKVLIHAATSLDHKGSKLSRSGHMEKNTICVILFIGNVQKRELYKDRK